MDDNVVSNHEQEPTHKLTPFERLVLQRFDQIDRRLDGIDGRLDGIDRRLDGVDGRLDGIDGRLDGIDGRLDGIDGRLDRVDDRLDKLEAKALDTKPIWEQALAEILNLKTEILNLNVEVVKIGDRLHNVEMDLLRVRGDLQGFDRRITALENLRQ